MVNVKDSSSEHPHDKYYFASKMFSFNAPVLNFEFSRKRMNMFIQHFKRNG